VPAHFGKLFFKSLPLLDEKTDSIVQAPDGLADVIVHRPVTHALDIGFKLFDAVAQKVYRRPKISFGGPELVGFLVTHVSLLASHAVRTREMKSSPGHCRRC
jgi:hypothetical protein